MPMQAASQLIALANPVSRQVERAFCQAACNNLSATIAASPTRGLGTPQAALVQRVVLLVQTRPRPPARQALWIDSALPSRPPFLAARLQV
ncbi:MAG: hypothetical protein HKL99_06225 [Burkholderiales bacterium]|nr:hypothetical protein [Burkholderiales bacterium]